MQTRREHRLTRRNYRREAEGADPIIIMYFTMLRHNDHHDNGVEGGGGWLAMPSNDRPILSYSHSTCPVQISK